MGEDHEVPVRRSNGDWKGNTAVDVAAHGETESVARVAEHTQVGNAATQACT